MLRKVLSKVDDGRFGRALAGMQAGWQWVCKVRVQRTIQGMVQYQGKSYDISVQHDGRLISCRCSCRDAVYHGEVCKHVAFAAMAEMAWRAAERSKHRQVELGQ